MIDATAGTISSAQRTVTAFFDDKAAATRAVESLVAAGIPRTNIRMVEGSDPAKAASQPDDKGFWESLKDFFFPVEDRYAYAEGLRRGGYLVTVTGNQSAYEKAADILEREGSINMDERTQAWRKEGWKDEGWKSYAAAGGAGAVSPRAAGGAARAERAVPVVEEQLRVGKRETAQGRVRIRSYVVESPVSEQVSLRDKHVTVERHATDRPLRPGEELFTDRTVEAEETREVPVVSKEARVTGEVVLRESEEQRTENVSDTVRRTKVEVDDTRSTAKRS